MKPYKECKTCEYGRKVNAAKHFCSVPRCVKRYGFIADKRMTATSTTAVTKNETLMRDGA